MIHTNTHIIKKAEKAQKKQSKDLVNWFPRKMRMQLQRYVHTHTLIQKINTSVIFMNCMLQILFINVGLSCFQILKVPASVMNTFSYIVLRRYLHIQESFTPTIWCSS